MASRKLIFSCFVLLIVSISTTYAQSGGEDVTVVMYDVGGALTLRCPLEGAEPPVWTKNGTAVDDVPELRGRAARRGPELALSGRALEADWGAYACAAGGRTHAFDVRGRVRARLHPDYSVVEEQSAKLQCRLVGRPQARVVWRFANASAEDVSELDAERMLNYSDVRDVFGERVRLERSDGGAEDDVLVLTAARRGDAGRIACYAAEGEAPPSAALGDAATLRVKDKYAALWPFLGICAEVAVLCAVILLYERRRAKPDLDDSDADNADTKKS